MCSPCRQVFSSANIEKRADFDNLVTFKLRVVKVVCSMLRRVVWASVRIDLKEYYGGLEQQVVELSL